MGITDSIIFRFIETEEMDEEELNAIDKFIEEYNHRKLPEFEGLSTNQMHALLYDPFGDESPLKLLELEPSDYAEVPILNQIKYLLSRLQESGEIKLTQKGFLPVKLLAEIYGQGYLKDDSIEGGFQKLYKETDSNSIHLSRLLLELAGLTKKRKGYLSLTKTGEKILANDGELLKVIFETFALKFNWEYFDGYENENVGQVGFGYSLLLLSKYGQEERPAEFYVEKYLKAFPQLLEDVHPRYGTPLEAAVRMYSIRTFDRFLLYFNFISKSGDQSRPSKIAPIKKTPLLDNFIRFKL